MMNVVPRFDSLSRLIGKMKIRAVTIVLFLFLVVGVVLAIVQSRHPRSSPDQGPPAAARPSRPDGTIAYYFHTSLRCATCDALKAYSREAVETGFADQVADGQIEWRAVNFELPENGMFRDRYQLAVNSLILVQFGGGEPVRSKNLARIWRLVGNKSAFLEYVQTETARFLAEADIEGGTPSEDPAAAE